MAKIEQMQEVAVDKLRPYANNAKQHSPEQVEKIANSIEEFGFLSPCIIDKDFNIIAGHGRVMAAMQIGRETVPCVFVEGLTEAQRKAYVLADNRLTELGDWNMTAVNEELGALMDLNFDLDLTGFEIEAKWFEEREKNDKETDGEAEEYADFVEKFEPKKTTDDCYTPEPVYDAVLNYCVDRYGIDKSKVVRPFYPGGDYKAQIYPAGSVVVDNPPFSIMSEILRFYKENNVKCFLFAPTLTLFTNAAVDGFTTIPVGVTVTYENGAKVNTSFLTNLEPRDIAVMSSPELYEAVREADEVCRVQISKVMPKYEYPDAVITSTKVAYFSKYGQHFSIKRDRSVLIGELDSQKESDDAIFGRGFLVSKKAAAEKAAAEKAAAEKAAAEKAAAEKAAARRWELSERELEIIEELSRGE